VENCSNKDGNVAERSIALLRTWRQVYDSFRLYESCDDGAIAEGYSNLIANILVKHWDWTFELSQLAQADPKFEAFIFKHLDTTMSPKQAQYITLHAHKKCPDGAGAFCNEIDFEIDNLK
jgi:hypothetical protein